MARFDLILSSGFLAFARHCGFLRAVEECALPIDGVCGTSSGALAGALWATGLTAEEVARELSAHPPLANMAPCWTPWRGLFSMRTVLSRMREMLPGDFSGLQRPFGAGVMGADGSHHVLTSGPLPEAVAASCAVPYLFAPVRIGAGLYRDGGAAERLGLQAWLDHRGDIRPLVHLVERSHGSRGQLFTGDGPVVRSPRSGARLWNLGDFDGQYEESRRQSMTVLDGL